MTYLFPYWLRYRKPFCGAVAFLSLEAVCDLLQPAIVSKIIDNGVSKGELAYVLKLSCLMLFVTAIGAIGAIGRNRISSKVSQSFGSDIRFDMFKKINSLTYGELAKKDKGGLITRMTNDSMQIQNFANSLMRIFIKAPILGIGAFMMIFFLNPSMTKILFVTVPVIIALIAVSLKLGAPLFIKMQEALDRINSVTREYLTGVRVVKAFNTFKKEAERFRGANESLSDASLAAGRVMGAFSPAISLVVNLSIVFLLWFARPSVLNGEMQVGQVIAFINYMSQILMSLTMIFNVYQHFIRAKASAERVGEILKPGYYKDEECGSVEVSRLKGEIRFDNVWFSYSEEQGLSQEAENRYNISNLSFALEQGGALGIIGSTGAGKTTVVNLMLGLYSPQRGSIYIDGKSIKEYNQNSLREHIAVVAQKTMLFTGTIADNIKWGKMDASDEEIAAAARLAQAHDFIMSFPDGYNTLLGQRGVNLSGGQKQRISIARGLIRNADIIIMDDCVSAVDAGTESKILEQLTGKDIRATRIMVSQKVSSIRKFPKILVLDNGKTEGIGTHDELIRTCAVYREICDSQG